MILLICLPQSLVVLLSLLLEELHTPLKGLVLGVVLGTLVGGILGILDGGLELLNFLLKQLVAVVEGCDLLLLGQVLLLQGLDLVLQLLHLLVGLVGLQAKLVHTLERTQLAWYRARWADGSGMRCMAVVCRPRGRPKG